MNGKSDFFYERIIKIRSSRTPRGERRHYISKGCDTRDSCTRRK